MKKIISPILLGLLIVCSILPVTSCQQLAQNGDFSGQWQFLSIDYPDGTSVNPQGERYLCVYRDVAQLTGPNGVRVTGNLAYDEDAGKFSIEFPYECAANLAPWGITAADEVDPDSYGFVASFTIQTLSSSRLVMTTNGVVITCRKF